MRNRLKSERENISKASSILVVGGGAVGVEVLGELIQLNAEIAAKGDNT